jgi:hypothetical protein
VIPSYSAVARAQPAWPRRWTPSGLNRPITIVALIAFLVLLVFLTTSIGLTILLIGGVLLAGLVLLTWYHPIGSLYTLVALGSVHQTAMLLVYSLTRSGTAVKAAQSWKDVILIVLLFKVIDLAFRRRKAPRLYLLDLSIGIFIAIGLVYLAYPSQVPDATFVTALFGWRADEMFFVAYFIGRGTPMSIGNVRTMIILLLSVGMLIAAVAAVQFVLPGPTNALFGLLGYQQFIGIQQTDTSAFALRENTLLGGLRIPRASSLLLSDLALSFHSLLLAPMALALFITVRGLWRRLLLDLVTLATAATGVLTVTRSFWVAIGPMLILVGLRGRGLLLACLVMAQLGFGGFVVANQIGITTKVLQYMFSTGESSTQGHLAALNASLAVMRESPFGRGLGTAGQVAQRLVAQGGLTNESWYLQIATEIGILPALLFFSVIIGFGVVAWKQAGRVHDPWLRTLCLGMLGATLGFAIVGFSLHVWEALTTSIIFWLLAGIVVRADQLEDASVTQET